MIVIGEIFDSKHAAPMVAIADIDADRKTEIAKDTKNNAYCVRFYNGDRRFDVALTHEALVALVDAGLQAICNPDIFNGSPAVPMEVIRA